jgi:DMSO/TMAO reductase YedYZ heme-binding membrane subunit
VEAGSLSRLPRFCTTGNKHRSGRFISYMKKVGVFIACLIPAAWLVFAALTDRLSANPIKDITEETGTWALRLLLITLCITPLRKLTGWNSVIRYRRMLGLYAFFYGFLHFLTYAWLDQFFSVSVSHYRCTIQHRLIRLQTALCCSLNLRESVVFDD